MTFYAACALYAFYCFAKARRDGRSVKGKTTRYTNWTAAQVLSGKEYYTEEGWRYRTRGKIVLVSGFILTFVAIVIARAINPSTRVERTSHSAFHYARLPIPIPLYYSLLAVSCAGCWFCGWRARQNLSDFGTQNVDIVGSRIWFASESNFTNTGVWYKRVGIFCCLVTIVLMLIYGNVSAS